MIEQAPEPLASPFPAGPSVPEPMRLPRADRGTWATKGIIAACVAMFFWVNSGPKPDLMADLERFGILSAYDIWDGAYWALFPPVITHVEIWHLAMNMMATWTLGARMERTVGPWKLLAFCIAAAPITTGFQLAASGTTGIGFSGVVFGLFGFLWAGARRYPEFRQVIHRQNLQMMLGWLVLCFVLSWTNVLPIANAGHVSGLLWGLLVAQAFAVRRFVLWAAAGLTAMIVGAVLPLFWAPWLVMWLGYKTDHALRDQEYVEAVEYLDAILEREPDEEWAKSVREQALRRMTDRERAAREARRGAGN